MPSGGLDDAYEHQSLAFDGGSAKKGPLQIAGDEERIFPGATGIQLLDMDEGESFAMHDMHALRAHTAKASIVRSCSSAQVGVMVPVQTTAAIAVPIAPSGGSGGADTALYGGSHGRAPGQWAPSPGSSDTLQSAASTHYSGSLALQTSRSGSFGALSFNNNSNGADGSAAVTAVQAAAACPHDHPRHHPHGDFVAAPPSQAAALIDGGGNPMGAGLVESMSSSALLLAGGHMGGVGESHISADDAESDVDVAAAAAAAAAAGAAGPGGKRGASRPRRTAASLLSQLASSRRRGNTGTTARKLAPNPNGHSCTACGAQSTPVWRAGPHGPKTLCNACGVRYMKIARRK
jgi:hypothetical protein